ncbi:ribonuclease H [Senna tora]|uniref:Ribonuclease H n=1 Tax=Senna tora TaxID=362788 RepID=A0A834X074_9FABA|nr:ribonuclease H [Senna tora]
MHLQNWRDLCKPKKQGGLALCNVYAFNQALLAKHVWRLIDQKNILIDSTLSAKYMERSNWDNLLPRSSSSWRWKAIMKTNHVIIPNLEWQIGDGRGVKTNHHAWWQMLRNKGTFSSVSDFIQHDSATWRTVALSAVYDPRTVSIISSIPLSITGVKDKFLWKFSNDGDYTTKEGYNWIKNSINTPSPIHNKEVWKIIWNLKLPNRIIVFMWRVLNNNLPAYTILVKHHMNIEDIYSACGQSQESLLHLFLLCPFARVVWFGTHLGYHSHQCHFSNMFDWFSDRMKNVDKDDNVIHFICLTLHSILRCRNLRVMEGRKLEPSQVISMIYNNWSAYKSAFNLQFKRGSEKIRKVFLSVIHRSEVILKLAYGLRTSEHMLSATFVVLRRGLQIAINNSQSTSDCNVMVSHKGLASNITQGYKKLKKIRVIGIDINNLSQSFANYNVLLLTCPSTFTCLFGTSCNNSFSVG